MHPDPPRLRSRQEMSPRFLNLISALLVSCLSVTLRADPRLLAKLPGPSGTAVAFSRDGKLLLSAGGDEARVWDAETYKPLTDPLRHGDGKSLTLAALSPDGRRVLTAHENEAWLWDVATGRRLFTIRHGGAIKVADFSPDGSSILTAGGTNAAELWDALSGERLKSFAQDDPVEFAAFAPNGSRLLTITAPHPPGSGGLQVWDVTSGRKVGRRHADLSMFGEPPTRRPAALSADGGSVLSLYTWIAFLWDADTGGYLGEVDGRPDYLGWDLGFARAVAFSPDGARVAVAGQRAAGVWPLKDGRLDDKKWDTTFAVQNIQDLQFSPDGRRLLIVTDSDHSGVWDVDRGEQVLRLTEKSSTKVPAVAFSPDGRRVAAGFPSDGFTGVWRVEPQTEQTEHP